MFSYRLKSLREDNDLTQNELANILNLSREAISGYEIKGQEPSFDIAIQIADYFNVSLDFLLGRTDIPTPYKSKKYK